MDSLLLERVVGEEFREAEVAEWSKAVDLGSIPKGRGFKPHLLHFLY